MQNISASAKAASHTADIVSYFDEYIKAALRHQIGYATLKNMDRNSLAYSFLPAQSIWAQAKHNYLHWNYVDFVAARKRDNPYRTTAPSQSCQHYLKANPKALLEWNLERQFAAFASKL